MGSSHPNLVDPGTIKRDGPIYLIPAALHFIVGPMNVLSDIASLIAVGV